MSLRKQMKERLNQVFASLGLIDKVKSNALDDQDWVKIAASYKEKFKVDLYEQAAQAEDEAAQARRQSNANLINILNEADTEDDDNPDATTEGDGTGDEDPDAQPQSEGDGTGEEDPDENNEPSDDNVQNRARQIVKQNKQLKQKVKTMAGQTQNGTKRVVSGSSHQGYGLATTEQYLFGIENPLFAMDKRWNKIAASGKQTTTSSKQDFDALQQEISNYGTSLCKRMATLHSEGKLNLQAIKGLEGDYSALKDAGLGEQFVIRRQDALISRILEMPNVFDVFPLRSNVQDQDLITNAFFGEFSQPHQLGEITKGDMTLQPEKAKVHKVMFKTLFESMEWMETQYIGYLNQNGSDPVKWSMIEWVILEISKVLNNERMVRYILGYRIEPTSGKTYSYLLGSTGVFHRLVSYVENLQVLPLKDEMYADYSQTTMYDVVDSFVDKVMESLDNLNGKALYLNSKHKKWFADSYREKFGKDMDFTGTQYAIMGQDIEVVWVPNMGNVKLMFITAKDNMQCLEFLPGEMNNIYFEQRLESVWAYSNWKEGTAAAYAGRKYETKEALEASNFAEQSIFMNWPVLEAEAGATVINLKDGILHKTGQNTAATAITNFTNPTPGLVYVLYAGSSANISTIAKTGKFDQFTAAWTPKAEGDFIKFYYDKTADKFMEVERKVTA